MLREVPGVLPPIDMSEPDIFEPAPELLDDIFGSAPNSPLQAATTHGTGGEGLDSLDALQISSHSAGANTERSDIPRLRSVHVTSGYRDGIAESKAKFVQEGFDEGFALGAVLGLKSGRLLGVLEGVVRAVGVSDSGVDPAAAQDVRDMFVKASEELGLLSLFGREWYGEDGIWKYEVLDGEADVTFIEVAEAHPLIKKWTVSIGEVERRMGLDLNATVRVADEDDDQGSL